MCRAWRDCVAAVSVTSRRRLAASAPAKADPYAWSDGRYVGASVLALWASQPLPGPMPAHALCAQARLVCASVTAPQVAAAVALSRRQDATQAAMAMLGSPAVSASHIAAVGSPVADGADTHDHVGTAVRRRCFTVLSPCHAAALSICTAAGPTGAGVAHVVVAFGQTASLPSVLAQIESAVTYDRAASALSLAAIAVARLYAQRMSPASAVETVLRRVWAAIAQHNAVRTARWLGSTVGAWEVPQRTGCANGGDPEACDAYEALGAWAWDVVTMWGSAPSVDWSCAVARLGHTRLLQMARDRQWPLNDARAFMAALCAGHTNACDLITRWHAADNDGRFGPLTCDRTVSILVYATSSQLCSQEVLLCGLKWLASAAPAGTAPAEALAQILAPWPVLPEAIALIDTWPESVVRSGYLCSSLAAYIDAARWRSADALATLAAARRNDATRAPEATIGRTGFALWGLWTARLAERMAYNRPNEDGGLAAVEALAVLCALGVRAGLLKVDDAPPLAEQVLDNGALGDGHNDKRTTTATSVVWADVVRPAPLSLALALGVRALATDDPRCAVRASAMGLARWLVRAGLCPDVFADDLAA